MPKKFLTILAVAAVTLSLAACTGTTESKTPAAACVPAKAGAGSAKITSKGDFGVAPTVTFATPLTAKSTERTVLTAGKGRVAVDGSTVTVNYSAFNATTGDKIEATSYAKDGTAKFTLDEAQLLPGLLKTIKCATPGTRIASVIPPVDAFGTTGSESLGIGASDALVFVIDIDDVSAPVKVLTKANGADQPVVAGLPTVKLASNGSPTITIPAATAPTDLKIQDLKKGTGTTVKEGDNVTVQYTGVLWGTGAVFDSSWTKGKPAQFLTTQVVPGFGKALVGQKVGSQVLAVIPPAEGYGPNGLTPNISGTDTLVFVVDILATQ